MEPASVHPTATVGGAVTRRDYKPFLARVRAVFRGSLRPLGTALCFFLLPFVRWFGMPSPFAAAFLLAREERSSFFSLLGISLSFALRIAWGLDFDLWQYAGLVLLWILRLSAKPKPGIETAALGGLGMMPRAVWSVFYGDPVTIVLSCAAVPMGMLCAAWFRHCLGGFSLQNAPVRSREKAAVCFLCLLLVSGLGYFRAAFVNLGQVAAVLCTLTAAGVLGCAQGAAAGLFCGLALALGGHDCRIAFSLSLCGLFCGFPWVAARRPLALPASMTGALVAFFVTPLAAPPLPYEAVLASGLLYLLIPKGLRDIARDVLTSQPRQSGSMETAFLTEYIGHLQESIRMIAKALPQSAEALPTGGEELGALLCAQCSNREMCWGRGKARTLKLMDMMMDLTGKGEAIQEDNLPALSQHGCLRADEISRTAQEALILQKKRGAQRQRTEYERELTLTHLAATLGTLNDLSMLAAGESLNDLRAAHILRQAMDELRIPARLLYARRIDGHLQVALQAENMFPVQKPLETLLRYLDKEEELPLSIARAEKGHIELEEIPLYSAAIGTASVCAGQKIGGGDPDVCGDACATQRCEGGRLLMMLCDGMGHGESAHAQSEKTLELLLLLLQAGYSRRQAITAVNGIMLGAQADQERFSTVDLADVDLWTGEVCCEKLGACPTWVVRGSHMKKVETSSLPLGILEEAKPTAIKYRLHSGDILVMMSDGVSDVFKDDSQMERALEESLYIQPQRMADALLRNALLAADGTPKDDMTVMVMLLMDRRR